MLFFADTTARCPKCKLLIHLKDEQCNHCNYRLTPEEISTLKKHTDEQEKKSKLLGLALGE